MAKKKKPDAESADRTLPVVGKLSLQKDPRVYATTLPRVYPPYKRILGVDLGSNCGVAFCDIIVGVPVVSANIVAGQWDLSIGSYDGGPIRHIRLKQFLAVVAPDLIMFEDVKFSAPTALLAGGIHAVMARTATAAEFLGSLKCTLTTWAAERDIPVEGVGIGEIKKYSTGRGNASKVDVIAAANAKFGTTLDSENYEHTGADNIADAMWVCAMAVALYSEGLSGESPKMSGGGAPDVVKSENHDD